MQQHALSWYNLRFAQIAHPRLIFRILTFTTWILGQTKLQHVEMCGIFLFSKLNTKMQLINTYQNTCCYMVGHASRCCVVCGFALFRGCGSNPTECAFCSLNFYNNTFVSIPLYLECILQFKFNSYRSLQNANFILIFIWENDFFLFSQNRCHYFQLIKWPSFLPL